MPISGLEDFAGVAVLRKDWDTDCDMDWLGAGKNQRQAITLPATGPVSMARPPALARLALRAWPCAPGLARLTRVAGIVFWGGAAENPNR
jgi:hypothetical protein